MKTPAGIWLYLAGWTAAVALATVVISLVADSLLTEEAATMLGRALGLPIIGIWVTGLIVISNRFGSTSRRVRPDEDRDT